MPAATAKPTKNQLRRAKKKAIKGGISRSREGPVAVDKDSDDATISTTKAPPSTEPSTEDELIDLSIESTDPIYAQFKGLIESFGKVAHDDAETKSDQPTVYYEDDDGIPDDDQAEDVENQGEKKLSKKARKIRNQLSIAELKALVRNPEKVEWTDNSASDPRLLVHLKSYKNVVPVPAHWALKREYLSSKRGVEKPAFQLPKFIQDTGIAAMRDAVLEKQDQTSLKQKQRERVQPKMGKLDIDYQKLYEAFFRFQTKPELTRYGEVYYEGKEYETNLRHLRPGELGDELKEALNIPPGAPPPWLINQQRFGPPPSYPALKIPGLNAPPPAGGQWGFHPGGYGKPPVDEYNRPLYGGDIFGVLQPQQNTQPGEPVEKTLWGELQEPEEESDDEDSVEDEDEDDEDDVGGGLQTPSGLTTPGGIASTVPSEFGGAESVAGEFNLRKQRRGTETEESIHPQTAHQILPEREIRTQGFFGGDRVYDLRGTQGNQNIPVLGQEDHDRKRKKPGDVDVAIDPEALQANDGLSKDDIKKRYETQKSQESGPWGAGFEEDLSDMIASESRKRQKRDDEKKKGRR